MSTTLLYVELIVVGLESFCWMLFSLFILTNIETTKYILRGFDSGSSVIFLLGILYIVGVIFDRFADMVFQRYEDYARKISGIESKSTVIIWKKSDQSEYYQYTRSRIRVLRASVLNIPLITISVCAFLIKYYSLQFVPLICIVVLLGIMSFMFTLISYKNMVRKYYEKARIIELEELSK